MLSTGLDEHLRYTTKYKYNTAKILTLILKQLRAKGCDFQPQYATGIGRLHVPTVHIHRTNECLYTVHIYTHNHVQLLTSVTALVKCHKLLHIKIQRISTKSGNRS